MKKIKDCPKCEANKKAYLNKLAECAKLKQEMMYLRYMIKELKHP
jgi:hypothetical protein